MLEKNELRALIDDEYFQPWIKALEKTTIQDINAFLQEAIYEFQYHTLYQIHTIQHFLDNLAHQFEKYTYYMISDPLLLEKCMRVAEIYLTNKINNTECKPGIIASIIRDLLFTYLNPLPLFNGALINSKTIFPDINDSLISSNIPHDLMPSIYGYLDYTSRFSFAKASKSAYFFHKKIMDTYNVLYVLGNEVQITESEGIWGINDYKGLVNTISKHMILNSLLDANNSLKQIKKLKTFTSLFSAIEYAHYQKHDDAGEDTEIDGFMPTIWAVLYEGNRNELGFSEEVINIHKGGEAVVYEGNSRLVWLEKGEIPQNSFIPLKGMALHSLSDFAEYKVFNQVNCIQTIQEQDECDCTLF